MYVVYAIGGLENFKKHHSQKVMNTLYFFRPDPHIET